MASNSEPQQAREPIIMRSDNDGNDRKINAREGASTDGIRAVGGWASLSWWRLLSALLWLSSVLSLVVWFVLEQLDWLVRPSVTRSAALSLVNNPGASMSSLLGNSSASSAGQPARRQPARLAPRCLLFPRFVFTPSRKQHSSYYRCRAWILSSVGESEQVFKYCF